MPYTLQDPSSVSSLQGNILDVDYGYKYPGGLDLKPGSELHQKILNTVNERALDGYRAMEGRHESWQEIDRALTAYISPRDKKKAKESGDKTLPVIIPTSYATLDTLLTYMTAVFLQTPYFKYSGVGPEDTVGTLLLEQLISFQAIRAKMGVNLHTMWRDSFSYGFGAVTPYWGEHRGWSREKISTSRLSITGLFGKDQDRRRRVETVLYEGNYLQNIDPYLYLPDPSVAIQDVQHGEFVGWIDITNRVRILEEEQAKNSFYFNAKYLRHVSGRSQLVRGRGSNAPPRSARQEVVMHMSSVQPVDRIFMYVNLIPEEWELGDSEYPEKWLFVVGSDKVVLAAQKLGLDHNMFPIAIAAPDYDGYSVNPISRLEIGYGIQETVDWLLRSHIANVRKAINDMLIVDPFLVNMKTLRDPEPGKLITTRRANWGKGVEGVVSQLKITDVTANHINDIGFLTNIHEKSSGTPEGIQGMMRAGGERRSATEARDTRQSALSKLERVAVLMDIQYRQDLAMMLASHTQQFASQERYIEIAGQREQELLKEHGTPVGSDGRVSVSPLDLLTHFDVLPGNGTIPGREPADLWIQLYQAVASNPELAQEFDMVRMFQHAARQLGARNVHDFVRRGGDVSADIVPTERVLRQEELGNLVRM